MRKLSDDLNRGLESARVVTKNLNESGEGSAVEDDPEAMKPTVDEALAFFDAEIVDGEFKWHAEALEKGKALAAEVRRLTEANKWLDGWRGMKTDALAAAEKRGEEKMRDDCLGIIETLGKGDLYIRAIRALK